MKKLLLTLLSIFVLQTSGMPAQAFHKDNAFKGVDYIQYDVVKYKDTVICSNNPALVTMILQVIKKLDEEKRVLPKIVVTDKQEFFYLTGAEIIDVRDGYVLGCTAIKLDIVYFTSYLQRYDTEKAYEVMFHEFGHIQNIHNILDNSISPEMLKKLSDDKYINKEFEKAKPLIKSTLGEYAATDEFEFVASFFAAMELGKVLPDSLYVLYLKWGGVK
jgi:hypothetical protein